MKTGNFTPASNDLTVTLVAPPDQSPALKSDIHLYPHSTFFHKQLVLVRASFLRGPLFLFPSEKVPKQKVLNTPFAEKKDRLAESGKKAFRKKYNFTLLNKHIPVSRVCRDQYPVLHPISIRIFTGMAADSRHFLFGKSSISIIPQSPVYRFSQRG